MPPFLQINSRINFRSRSNSGEKIDWKPEIHNGFSYFIINIVTQNSLESSVVSCKSAEFKFHNIKMIQLYIYIYRERDFLNI